MTSSLRKKIVSSVISQWKVQETLELMDILLVMMKKFWKQLSQTPVKEFFEKNYPDVAKFYVLLWGSCCTIKHCLLLKQYLCESLGESFLLSESSNISVVSQLAQVDTRITVNIWGDGSNPVLSIHSPSKIYKRSLYDDLQKLF